MPDSSPTPRLTQATPVLLPCSVAAPVRRSTPKPGAGSPRAKRWNSSMPPRCAPVPRRGETRARPLASTANPWHSPAPPRWCRRDAQRARRPPDPDSCPSELSTESSEGKQHATMVAYSSDIGAASGKRSRWKRYTGVPGLKRSVSASSGVTVPSDLRSHSLCGVRPRARMSSENEVSLAKFFSTRVATKLPAP